MQVFATKGNLIQLKKQLSLAKVGYELLDRKRNIMLRELLNLAALAADLQKQADRDFRTAYSLLQEANFKVGKNKTAQAAHTVDLSSERFTLRERSVMGVEICEVIQEEFKPQASYGFFDTGDIVDRVYVAFNRAKQTALRQTALETGIYRLCWAIKQSQKRANALKNIVIPNLESQISYIASYLEEKERDEFAALKLIKAKM